MKYSDQLMDWMVELGYTHCFFVGGGNVMHLLESARTRFECVAVVHEVAAAIAAEYFNETSPEENGRAFAMVTAGPGVTNLVTGVAGSWLESRELLIIAGQARTGAMSDGNIRQVGHQEINAVGIMKPITKFAHTAKSPISKAQLQQISKLSKSGRKGPVFLEFCLDVTGMNVEEDHQFADLRIEIENYPKINPQALSSLKTLIVNSERPIFLFGGGLDRIITQSLVPKINKLGIPVVTTWNGSDKYPGDELLYVGRPNTYGMRRGNIAIQQADLVIALGTRLGLQQTGFNWEQFVPVGKLVQVEIDNFELEKENPKVDLAINSDANEVLCEILKMDLDDHYQDWRTFLDSVIKKLPLKDPANIAGTGFIEPFDFVLNLNQKTSSQDIIIPCSSGGAFTTMMQAFLTKGAQPMVTDKGLASMGYGLSGAIGASVANRGSRVVLTEGDGGFAQNLQELGTVANRNLNIKIFIYSNQGYASIRTMQKAYFNGNYVGCDAPTGVGLPDWKQIFRAYNIDSITLDSDLLDGIEASKLFENEGPAAFILPLDPEQTYYPKVLSRVSSDGQMESNPIHLMSPDLDPAVTEQVFKYLPLELR